MVIASSKRDHKKRYRENRCRDRLESWLRSYAVPYPKIANITWQAEPCGHDRPPDYLLTLDSKQFAVEVTAIPHHEIVLGKPIPEEGVTSSMRSVVNRVREECVRQGILTGFYYVHFTKGIPNLSKAEPKIIEQIVRYVAETHTDYEAPKRPIVHGSGQVCTIEKPHSVIHDISLGRSIDRAGGVPLCDLARNAVDNKARRLRGTIVPNIFALPRILILDADERSEPPEEWTACLASLPSLSDFHSIFVVPGIQPVFPICVGEPDWPLF